eukprot:gene15486-18389_t
MLSKKSYKSICYDLSLIISQYGNQAEHYLFRNLVDCIDFKDPQRNQQRDAFKIQLFRDEFSRLMKQPNFTSTLCKALEGVEQLNYEFLTQISQTLKLTAPQDVLLGLAVAQVSDPTARDAGEKHLLSVLASTNIKSLPENVLHQLFCRVKFAELAPGPTSPQTLELLRHIQPLLSTSRMFSPFAPTDTTVSSKRAQDALVAKLSASGGFPPPYQLLAAFKGAATSAVQLKELLTPYLKLVESDIAQIVGMMAEHTAHPSTSDSAPVPFLSFTATASPPAGSAPQEDAATAAESPKSSTTWTFGVFVEVIRELYPHIDWSLVIRELDYPEFMLADQRGLTLILSIFKRAAPADKFPVHHILERVWSNSLGQISFLKVALQSEFPFHFSQKKRIEYSALGKVSQTVAHWNSLSLIEVLLLLSEIDQDHYNKTRSLFDYPVKHCPELLLMGLSSLSAYISQLWKEYPNIVVCGIVKELAVLASQREYLFLERWLQERIKDDTDFEFVQSCIFFLMDRIAKRMDATHISISSTILLSFYRTLISNIDSFPREIAAAIHAINPNFEEILANSASGSNISISSSGGGANTGGSDNPSGEQRRFPEDIEDETNSYFIKLYKEEISVDQIINTLKEYKNSQVIREQEIYKCLLFNLFDEYKFLSDYPDKELKITAFLFGSLIKNQLISSQPLRVALKYVLEAIKHQAGSNMFVFGITSLLSFANRLVEWPQYWSQICSIEQFKNYSNGELVKQINVLIENTDLSKNAEYQRSINLPSSGISLQQIQDAESFNFESNDDKNTLYLNLSEKPDTVAPPPSNQQQKQAPQQQQPQQQAAQQPSHQSSGPAMPPHGGDDSDESDDEGKPNNNNSSNNNAHKSGNDKKNKADKQKEVPESGGEGFTSLPLGTLLQASKEIIQPEEVTKDKMFFIINNVSMFNVDNKVKEMKEVLRPEFYDFLAQYLVVKRVSIEPNFHKLYLHFLERLAIDDLSKRVLGYTHQNILTLLKSDKIKVDHSERSLLKNLGGWLGMLTLGKNKPLLQKFISPKELLIYGNETGTLIAIVPFVSKLLESAANSRVFKPPNPWVMAIVRLLMEIYYLKESKNNIKFEVELLTQNLKLNMADIKPSTIIKDRRREEMARAEEHESARMMMHDGHGLHHQQQSASAPSAAELLANISAYIQYNPSIANIAAIPVFKTVVPMCFERAIKDIIGPVVERSVAIGVITSKELVSKDFATEADEKKMKKASHLMVQNLAGSLALVTCKDPLRVGMVTHLRSVLQQIDKTPFPPELEHAISTVCADNLEFACSIVERAATEKAVVDIDAVLSSSYMERLKHKESAGMQPYFDMGYLTTTIYNNLPEPLRPKPGGIQPDQFRVYEDFLNLSHHTNIALAQPSTPSDMAEMVGNMQPPPHISSPPSMIPSQMGGIPLQTMPPAGFQQIPQQQIPQQPQLQQQQQQQSAPSNPDLLEKFTFLLNDVDKVVIRVLTSNGQVEFDLLYTIVQQMMSIVMPSTKQSELIQGFAQKLFARLCDPEKKPIYEIYFELLEVLRDWDPKILNTITSILLFSNPDRRLNRMLVAGLIVHQLINVNEYDQQLATMMIGQGRHQIIEFATNLLRFVLVENTYAVPSEFVCVIDIIGKIAAGAPGSSDIINKTLEDIKSLPPVEEKKRRISRIKQEEMNRDPPGLKEASISLLQDWHLFSSTNTDQKMFIQYMSQVLQLNMMKNEVYFQKFFRMAIEWIVEKYTAAAASAILESPTQSSAQSSAYVEIDSFCRLVVLFVKHADPTHLNILTKVLSMLIKVLTKDYENNSTRFNQRPYLRIFENLMTDLNAPDPILEQASTPILYCFVNALAALQPLNYPGFCFAWLDLISHRSFMPKLLVKPQQKSWFHTLLMQHFRFMEPFLRRRAVETNSIGNGEPMRLLYKGTLKILLVLLHDFPEFLCEFHFSFCDVIPSTCIQLRNLILSAFPDSMRLPDPFTPNLKVDLLPDINVPPKISSNFTQSLKGLKNEIDAFFKTRGPVSFLHELKHKVLLSPGEQEDNISGTKYNVPLINSLVLYAGTLAISQIQRKSEQSGAMDIYHRLSVDLDAEGRYLVFNAITNQLRYPNNHTHYFSCVILYLFAEATQDNIKEQITRVLLERLISNKPHPWGLLITFIELIRNPRYNFWMHQFTKIAPEIEQLFESVAYSCIQREASGPPASAITSTPPKVQRVVVQSQPPIHPSSSK